MYGPAPAEDFNITFFPYYPPAAGEETRIRVKTDLSAEKITAAFENEDMVPLEKKGDFWIGEYKVPENFAPGSHTVNIYFRQKSLRPASWWEKFLNFLKIKTAPRYNEQLIKRSETIKIIRKEDAGQRQAPLPYLFPYSDTEEIKISTEEVRSYYEEGTSLGELLGTPASREAFPLKIKGNRIFAFSSKSMEGSRESYLPGTSREESLRLNVSGKIDSTEIDANFFSTSSLSTTQIATREEKVSILLKRGSTEAYMGDFNANFNETEFTKLNLALSGIRVKGDYGQWGFKAIATTPQGLPKLKRFYGDGTQGPYQLDLSPVVVDSERVYLNRALQKRGEDYIIDYNAGTVTFLKTTVISTSIIEVYYDYRNTVYQHSLYGFRGYIKPTGRLKVGATYLNDSDTLQNAASIQSQTGINPAGHHVFGVDSSLVLPNFSFDSEFALSEKNYNLLGPGTKESGTAGKVRAAGKAGAFGFSANYKKINPGFETAATALQQKNLLDYGGTLSFNPGSIFLSQLSWGQNKYTESDVNYEVINRSFKNALRVPRLPELEYNLFEDENSNDPVSGSEIRRIITKNQVKSNYKNWGIFNLSAQAERQRWLNRYPTEEATLYDIAAAGISTNPKLKNLAAALNVEYKKTTEPLGYAYSAKTYDLKLSAQPDSRYFLSGSLHYVDDKKDGITNVTDLVYNASPDKKIKSDGKYTIQSVNETFGSSEARVSKQSGSLKLELRPREELRLRYYFKPNFTSLDSTGQKIYNNENHQAEASWAFMRQAVLSYSYKAADNFTIDKTTYPVLYRNSSSSLSGTNQYSLKAAPLSFMSTEFNVIIDQSAGNTLNSTTAASSSYRRNNGKTAEYNAGVKTSLTRDFAIDAKYSHKTTLQGTEESIDDQAYTIDQTGSAKGIWTVNPSWRLSASGSFTLSRNFLSNTKTYTLSPGIGFIYTLGSMLRVDGDYNYSRSYSAIQSSGHKFSLKGKYTLSKYVNVSLQYQRETSSSPYYRTMDIAGIVEINM